MILGMSIARFTEFHVVLSLVGIVAGIVVLIGLFGSKRLPAWTAVFLATTVLTSITGFFFPRDHLLPSHIVGILSLILLAIALIALYAYRLGGAWRWIYITGAVWSLYLNVFVGVVQAFQKIPFLHPLAPTQSEPPFAVAQGLLLLAAIGLFVMALRSFHPRTRDLAAG